MQLSQFLYVFVALTFYSVGASGNLFAAGWKVLHGHVPPGLSKLNPIGSLAGTNQMRLAIGVPLRDSAGLDEFLAQLYDPASTNYQHYLTPDELTARFGPTEQDYAAVKEFARTNGLTVAGTFSNRLVLDVTGTAASVEKAFHITLHTYQHPTEARQFFAPDTEPGVSADLPVADIQGLSDFSKPRPHARKAGTVTARPKNGSASNGGYIGDDFRNAYAPGVTLTGAGQRVGLFEYDGFVSSDITAYATSAGNGRSSIVVQAVSVNSYNGAAGSGQDEVELDIELAMAMAPGLAAIYVFEAPTSTSPNVILNSMYSYSGIVKNLSCSWGWGGGPTTTTDAIFKNMAAAGQSFFNASGDTDAFTTGSSSPYGVDNLSLANAPSSSPYITQVGGTTLTSGASGSYLSETVWNWGVADPVDYDGVGSSGGISSYYNTLPSWQTNISNMVSRGGSATNRNIPDVALTADNIYVVVDNGQPAVYGGTSCAAPLWAGFMALDNQQAAANGRSPVGFINPAIYAIAGSANYSACFHDVTTGSNTWSASPGLFLATTGYDLCTGLGTPNGANLINALAPPLPVLSVLGGTNGYTFGGLTNGPFSPGSGSFILTNVSISALNWSLIKTSAWLTANFTNGPLAAHTMTNLNVSLTVTASNLAAGTYSTTIAFTNLTSHTVQMYPITLTAIVPMAFKSTVQLTNNMRFTWNTTTGAVYQVQYKTNLFQTNWINLSTAITAASNTLAFTDTNAVKSSPQRFYRLSVTP